MLVEQEPYSLNAAAKQPLLLAELNALTEHHQQHCLPYQHLLQAQWPQQRSANERLKKQREQKKKLYKKYVKR